MSSPNGKNDIVIPTVREVQQIFAELLAHGEDITWDLLSHSQSAILKAKVGKFLDTLDLRSSLLINSKFFNRIWEQRKYTNGQSLSSLFFVMIVDDFTDATLAEQSRSWHLYPVFRCRRCVEDTSGNNCSTVHCCMVYVTQYDTFQNWDSFVTSVRLRAGIMVTPYRGVYKLIDGQVELKTYLLSEPIASKWLPMGPVCCITPESLKEASTKPSNRYDRFTMNIFTVPFTHLEKHSSADWMLYPLLLLRDGQAVQGEMSSCLVVFTHAVNNSRLVLEMIIAKAYRGILGNRLKKHFDKISEETQRIEGRVNLIRSANEVPPRPELDRLFSSKRKRTQEPGEPREPPLVRVKGEVINFEDYGSALKEHIVSPESFEDLIICMSEHLEPEMFKIIIKLTQHFMEIIREGLWHLLKYHIPTETVLYQIILDVIESHPDLNVKKVEDQSSDILGRVRLNFVLANPNPNPDFLTKCPKCGNFFDKFINNYC